MENRAEMETSGETNHGASRKSAHDSFRQTVLTPEQAAEIKRTIASARPKRTFRFHMKLVGTDPARRNIEGYASTRDLDLTGEVVEPGAFAESLKDFMANPVVTYMHDWSDPIGKVVDARTDDVGLFIRAEISETAGKVWKLIEEGVLRAFSIGYEVVEEKLVDGANHILKLRLYEVAIVSIPANRRALFSVAKGLMRGTDIVCANCANEGERRKEQDEGELREARRVPGSESIVSSSEMEENQEQGNVNKEHIEVATPSADGAGEPEVSVMDAELGEAHAILKGVMEKLNGANVRE
ncbi:HK97 family phage prohead protease [Candidatus Poribacteria bacterium]|nr:HK97 family phage prohead protease [Candidatus Poribacteria bacterium]